MTHFFLSVHQEKKMSHFDLKSWVTGWTKNLSNFFGQNDSIFLSLYREKKIESFWSKKLSHWRTKIWPNYLGQKESIFLSEHREKKLSHFDLKSWVTGETIIRPTFITGPLNPWIIESTHGLKQSIKQARQPEFYKYINYILNRITIVEALNSE